jgi:hypothetical protein
MGLVRLVSRMLEKRREDRPSWREIVDGLVSVLREAGSPLPPSSVDADSSKEPTHPTQLVATPREAPPEKAPIARAAVAVILLAGSLGFLIVRRVLKVTSPTRPSVAASSRHAPAPPGRVTAPGSVRLLATPFARVVSVTNTLTGKPATLPPGTTTPALLDGLAPGVYRVVLSCPALEGKTAERDVAVRSGETALVVEPFLSGAELAERLR